MRMIVLAAAATFVLICAPAQALNLNTTDVERPAFSSETTVPIPSLSSPSKASENDAATEILSDLDVLPEPVRRMREKILEACRKGDIEALRVLMGTGDSTTQLSFGEPVDDPIAFLKDISGDSDGYEMLAILAEVLEEDFVHLDAGTGQELYVWPYFFAYPLEKLTGPQRVRLFRLVTSGDYEGMLEFGGYNFYRAGFTPDGRWAFFVAGD